MWKEFFIFSRQQQRGILILMGGILICSFISLALPYLEKEEAGTHDEELRRMLASLQTGSPYDPEQADTAKPLRPFPFDPNTLDSAGFARMGLRSKLIHTLMNYRHKGGVFYNKESFKRIYTLRPEEYEQLQDYIVIEHKDRYVFEKKPLAMVDLNSADSTELIALPGIGSATARSILSYRTQLGGFVHKQQLREVYGMTPERYQQLSARIFVRGTTIRKLDLNAATFAELNSHPYLKGELARAITAFRKENNYRLHSLEQLREIELINDEIFRKIAPYLRLQ